MTTMPPPPPPLAPAPEDEPLSAAALAAAGGALPSDSVRLEHAAIARKQREARRDPGQPPGEQLAAAEKRRRVRERVADAAQQLIARFTEDMPEPTRTIMAWGTKFEADACAAFFDAVDARTAALPDGGADADAATAALLGDGEDGAIDGGLVLEELVELFGADACARARE